MLNCLTTLYLYPVQTILKLTITSTTRKFSIIYFIYFHHQYYSLKACVRFFQLITAFLDLNYCVDSNDNGSKLILNTLLTLLANLLMLFLIMLYIFLNIILLKPFFVRFHNVSRLKLLYKL